MSNTTPPPPPAFPPPAPLPKRNRTNAVIIGAAVAVIAAIVTTGVVVVNARDDDASTASSAASSSPTDETITAVTEPEPTPENTEPEVMGLTDGVAYEDGVEVTLSGYKRGTSSEYAAPGNTPYVSFTVKVVNKSEAALDLGTGFVMCYYGDESTQAEQIFEEGMSGLPTMSLRAGRTASAKVGCEMPKGEEYLQVEMAPSMESAVAIFAGNVK